MASSFISQHLPSRPFQFPPRLSISCTYPPSPRSAASSSSSATARAARRASSPSSPWASSLPVRSAPSLLFLLLLLFFPDLERVRGQGWSCEVLGRCELYAGSLVAGQLDSAGSGARGGDEGWGSGVGGRGVEKSHSGHSSWERAVGIFRMSRLALQVVLRTVISRVEARRPMIRSL